MNLSQYVLAYKRQTSNKFFSKCIVIAPVTDLSYSLTNIQAVHSIQVTFKPEQYLIRSTC
ncbi:hypothetical protein MHK_001111, partial [Candidatus Magnetomorum sp. HK-1]